MNHYDIIVVGAGLAGLCAAISVVENSVDKNVLLLEQESQAGGNSAKASSGINWCDSKAEEADLLNDTLRSARDRATPLTSLLIKDSAEARRFLERHNVGWLAPATCCGGHSNAVTHAAAQVTSIETGTARNTGWELIAGLQAALQQKFASRVTLRTNCRVASLLQKDKKVCGVKLANNNNAGDGSAVEHIYASCAIVLATGGFSANQKMLKSCCAGGSSMRVLSTTNGQCAQGSGIIMAQFVGAQTSDLDCVQVHPTAFVDEQNERAQQKFLAPEALRATGAVMLHPETGNRFVDELQTRDAVVASMLANLSARSQYSCHLVLTGEQALHFAALPFYLSKKLIRRVDGGKSALATVLKVSSVQVAESSHYFVARVCPSVHYTMGGVTIDSNGQVLNAYNVPIKRLFACGEVTGGIHGRNRLAGNSLLDCVVFGIRAGKACALLSKLAARHQ